LIQNDEEQRLRFVQVVQTLRAHTKRFERQGRRENEEGIRTANFLIDEMLKGKRINSRFQVIPETTQENMFKGIEEDN